MKIKTQELEGAALDWAVAKCEGALSPLGNVIVKGRADRSHKLIITVGEIEDPIVEYSPSTDWAQGGPLLNRHKISRTINHSGLWIAYAGYNLNDEPRHMQCDRSELVAGLRCLVALNLGEVVDVPEELLELTWQ